MLATALSASIVGVEGVPVRVEVDVAFGLPGITIVGLAGSAVLEARERVRAALRNSGFEVPARRITINLAPADLPKEGTGHDLAMATGILVASGQLTDASRLERTALIGELALDGSLRPVPGVMALVCGGAGRRRPRRDRAGRERAPKAPRSAASRVRGGARLRQVTRHLAGLEELERAPSAGPRRRAIAGRCARTWARSSARSSRGARWRSPSPAGTTSPSPARRASARRCSPARPPGCCRSSTSARRPRSAASTRSPACASRARPLSLRRPFRAPHHTISTQALVGGGPRIRPGEASLAHRGALFLDETLQFRADALDALRGPIDAGAVTIARVEGVLALPARFMLLAAFNPCPCGWFGVDGHECACEDGARRRYQARLSGPMRDRLDMIVPLEPVAAAAAAARRSRPPTVAARVATGRRDPGRAAGDDRTPTCRRATSAMRSGFERAAPALLDTRGRQMGLSMRRLHRAARVARTIADLAGSTVVRPEHLDEALIHRPKEVRRVIGVGSRPNAPHGAAGAGRARNRARLLDRAFAGAGHRPGRLRPARGPPRVRERPPGRPGPTELASSLGPADAGS